jgi:HK97 family phage major capsid protein
MSTAAPAAPPSEAGADIPKDDEQNRTRYRVAGFLRAEGAEREPWEDDPEAAIPLAISSEAPVLRYDWRDGYYYEVLDHSPGCIDLSYAADGLPFCVEHNTRDQVGIVEGVRLDGDRKTRGEMRSSESVRGKEIRSDIVRRIRKKISFGYDVDDTNYVVTKADGDLYPTRTYKRWMPLEVSTVAIPADYSVGVGRSAEQREGAARNNTSTARHAAEENTVSGTATAPAPGATANVDPHAERTAGLIRLARDHGAHAELAGWLEGGKTVEQAQGELLARARAGNTPIDTTGAGSPTGVADVQLSEREQRQYSIVRGMQRMLAGKRDGFEFEVSEECSKQLGRDTQGFFVPMSLRAAHPDALKDTPGARRALGMPDAPGQTRTMSVGGATLGAESVFTEYGGLIDVLRNRSAVLKLGAQMLPGLQGDVGFVTLTAGTVGWTAEATNIAVADVNTGLRKMGPKPLQGARAYTRQLLLQSVFSVENMVRTDLALGHALEIDRAAINGSGTGNEPRGIRNTVGIGNVSIGTNGGAPTYEHLVDLEAEITTDNADIGAMGILTNARMRAKLRKTQEFSGTNGRAIWTGGVDGECAGYPAMASNQVPGNLTKGTSTDCHAIIQAVWSELLIGEWGALEVILDQTSLGPSVVKVMSIEFVDIFLRQIAAFAAIQDARNV